MDRVTISTRKPTPRQLQVLQLLASGYTDRGASVVLGTSPETVRTQVALLRLRMGCRTRGEAIAMAIRLGWIN